MQALWRALFEQVSAHRTTDEARRTANFLLAAALAAPTGSKKPTPRQLCARADHLAASIGSPVRLGKAAPKLLLDILKSIAPGPLEPPQFDAWIEAFERADGRRKSLGAFATPTPFADALAQVLLPEGDIPATYRVVDPAVGAGNLLAAVYRALVGRGWSPNAALQALHGMELDPAARELCILHLWLLAPARRQAIEGIASRIRLGNALTQDWWSDQPLFDGLIMNPPWESLRHAASCESLEAERRATLERLTSPHSGAQDLPPLYSCHGRGDRNLFKAFVELAPHLLRDGGRLSALLPAAFGSDDGMADLRRLYLPHLGLDRWTTFENRGKYFAIDSRYKFGILAATRTQQGTAELAIRSFCTHPEALVAPHVATDVAELRGLFGGDVMIPELTSAREWEILSRLMKSGEPFFDSRSLGRVIYRREIDLTLGRRTGSFFHIDEAFQTVPGSTAPSVEGHDMVPLLEGRMVGQYDCFQKSFVGGSGRTAVWEANDDRPIDKCRPQFVAPAKTHSPARLAICDITSATNTRTVLATLVPANWLCGNTAPVLQFENEDLALAGLVILNSLTFDWMARRIVSGLHLNKFYLAHLRWPALTGTSIQRLSELGRMIVAASPRGEPTLSRGSIPNDPARIAALAEAEALLTVSFGLAYDDVAFMLSDDPTDRRGFWRYYDSFQGGRSLAEAILRKIAIRDQLAA